MGEFGNPRQKLRRGVQKKRIARVYLAILSSLAFGELAGTVGWAQTPSTTTLLAPAGGDSSGPPEKVGEALYNLHCVVCHQDQAKGQVGLAPNIRSRDFLALASDEFIKNTVTNGRVGTAMVARPDLAGEPVDSIISFLRSARFKNPLSVQVDWHKSYEGNKENGATTYAIYCSPCHGPNGEGYGAGVVGTGIGLPGFLSAASDDYILQTVKIGRLGTPMQSFIGAKGLANLSEQEVIDVIAHLRHLGENYVPEPSGVYRDPNPALGGTHFTIHCAPCHQVGGEGKIGFAPSIRNRDFLAIASDEFIAKTVHDGRAGTGMLPRPDLSDQTVADIISYLRALPVSVPIEVHVDSDKTFSGDLTAGEGKYQIFCASCHGPNGEGYTIGLPGTSIGLAGFLNVASDDYIFQTLKTGRVGTPMKSFLGSKGLANLDNSDAYDIIAYLRTLPSKQAAASPAVSDFE